MTYIKKALVINWAGAWLFRSKPAKKSNGGDYSFEIGQVKIVNSKKPKDEKTTDETETERPEKPVKPVKKSGESGTEEEDEESPEKPETREGNKSESKIVFREFLNDFLRTWQRGI